MWVLVGGRGHLLEQFLKILDVCFYPHSRKLRFWHLPGVGTFAQGFESEAHDIHRQRIHPVNIQYWLPGPTAISATEDRNKRPPLTCPCDITLPEFWPLCFSWFLSSF